MARRDVKAAQRRRSTRTSVPGVEDFRADPLLPKIERAVASILAKGNVVAPVDVLVAMHLLAPDGLEDWLRGRVPYLEQVIRCNLTRLSRLLRILRFHAHDLNLVPTQAEYHRRGKAGGRLCAALRLAGEARVRSVDTSQGCRRERGSELAATGRSPAHPALGG